MQPNFCSVLLSCKEWRKHHNIRCKRKKKKDIKFLIKSFLAEIPESESLCNICLTLDWSACCSVVCGSPLLLWCGCIEASPCNFFLCSHYFVHPSSSQGFKGSLQNLVLTRTNFSKLETKEVRSRVPFKKAGYVEKPISLLWLPGLKHTIQQPQRGNA